MTISSPSLWKPSHHIVRRPKLDYWMIGGQEERGHLDSLVTAELPAECSHTGDLCTPDRAELPSWGWPTHKVMSKSQTSLVTTKVLQWFLSQQQMNEKHTISDVFAQFGGSPEKEDLKKCFRLGSLEADVEIELHKVYWVMWITLKKYTYRNEEAKIGPAMWSHLRPQPILWDALEVKRNSRFFQIEAKGVLYPLLRQHHRLWAGCSRRHNLSQDMSLQLRTVPMEECSCEPSETVFSVAEDRGTSCVPRRELGEHSIFHRKWFSGTWMATGKCLVKRRREAGLQAKETPRTKAQMWKHAWQVQKRMMKRKGSKRWSNTKHKNVDFVQGQMMLGCQEARGNRPWRGGGVEGTSCDTGHGIEASALPSSMGNAWTLCCVTGFYVTRVSRHSSASAQRSLPQLLGSRSFQSRLWPIKA